MDRLKKIKGSLLGGAVGDALGYGVEFCSEKTIFSRYGEKGICDYLLVGGKGIISDDTQMTLYTANGLLCVEATASDKSEDAYIASVWRAYLDWLKTQNGRMSREVAYSFLNSIPELFAQRAPGGTCLSALEGGVAGSMKNPVNHSKGCGGVMRAAPVGLYFAGKAVDGRTVATVGAAVAALTHGHPLGYLPAAFLAHLVWELVKGKALLAAVSSTRRLLGDVFSGEECYPVFDALVEKAVALAVLDKAELDCIHALGEGWVGEEALAIALYCALRHPNDFEKAVVVSVNHKGDSDSTGAILGNILGAHLGIDGIPARYLADLELCPLIEEMATDLATGLPDAERTPAAYRLFRQKYYRPARS